MILTHFIKTCVQFLFHCAYWYYDSKFIHFQYVCISTFITGAIIIAVVAGYENELDKLLDFEVWGALIILSLTVSLVLPMLLCIFLSLSITVLTFGIVASIPIGIFYLIGKQIKAYKRKTLEIERASQRTRDAIQAEVRNYAIEINHTQNQQAFQQRAMAQQSIGFDQQTQWGQLQQSTLARSHLEAAYLAHVQNTVSDDKRVKPEDMLVINDYKGNRDEK